MAQGTHVSIRIHPDERTLLERLREELQREAGMGEYITQRDVIMRALDAYAKYRARLTSDRARQR